MPARFPCILAGMTIAEFLGLRWSDPGEALIEPPFLSPVLADPSFLFPEETPDGRWALFAHSAWGVHRYASRNGVAWEHRGLAVRNAMRPFIRRSGAAYYLYYELYPPLALAATALPGRRRWRSALAVSESPDLLRWSAPRRLAEPSLDWMRDERLGDAVSNPCLVPPGDVALGGDAAPAREPWRLYFSASLSFIEDCGFCEPRFIGLAEGPGPLGPFSPLPSPVLDPKDDPLPGALGSGSIKVLRLSDGYLGLQNKIYADEGGRSRSAIFALRSPDGLAWTQARAEPLVAPGRGWTRSHVYACDCRRREADGRWYLYFNARDGWRIAEGRERIGRIVAEP